MRVLQALGIVNLGIIAFGTAPIQAQISGNSSIVGLDYGTFIGRPSNDNSITYFRGIRYADVPTGDLRFRAPVSPPQRHLGTVNATEFAPACLQAASATTEGSSEDCLFLNVNVPAHTTADDKLPVLVWIHGGGFQGGNANQPPDYLLHSSTKPLIFVSVQYRLGLFGFLAGQAVDDYGDLNAGLLDQRAALRWVRRYIGAFGGDPSKVTIFGESAGGAGIYYQLIAKDGDNEGLYVRAIADSPSLGPLLDCTSPYEEGLLREVAEAVDCSDPDPAALLACLRATDVGTLAAASPRVLAQHPASIYAFGPCLDGEFLTSRIVDAFEQGKVAQVPLLVGSNTDEGVGWSAGLAAPWANTSMPNATEETVFEFLRGQYPGFTRASFEAALELYPLAGYGRAKGSGAAMYGEARYICPAVMAGELGREVYQYRYDNPLVGSTHAAELVAFYGSDSVPDPADRALPSFPLWDAMRRFWTAFAVLGRPEAEGVAAWVILTAHMLIPFSQPNQFRFARNARLLLNTDVIAMEQIPDGLRQRCAFWRSLRGELAT
ncbi:Alpha/Beta hydrolase protein [Schizophyllum fasciatum]